jgi:hypothetical protein
VSYFEAGVEVGDFRIEKRIGAGGMGVVYQARQISLDRVVALKVLGAAFKHPSEIIRFRREAQTVARLKHPGIASIYYIGQDEQACYMAMEFVDGVTLRELIDRLCTCRDPHLGIETMLQQENTPPEERPPRVRFDNLTVPDTEHDRQAAQQLLVQPLTPQAADLIQSSGFIHRACEIVRDAAAALDHAHTHHVVHRDIKPNNIMLDKQGFVHVIDFGIARFLEDFTLTLRGELVGTPMYMSPEQVAGRMHVDHRSDIYSLGLVLYELLTLSRPMLEPNREALLRGVVTKSLVPVSWKNPEVPRNLESVVHKAIAKDPDDRYQSANEFAADIERCLQDKPVLADPYHYKFDEREILAERPSWVTAAAFWFFFVAIVHAVMLLPYEMQTVRARIRYMQARPAAYARPVFIGLPLAIAALAAGWSTLKGRRLAQQIGIPAAVVATGLSMASAIDVGHGAMSMSSRETMLDYLLIQSVWIAPRVGIIMGGLLTIWLLVFHHRSREWFHFSQRYRAAHRARALAALSKRIGS